MVSLGPGGITGIASKLDMTEGGGAGGVLTVTVIPGELVTVSHGDKSQTKAANASGVAVFKGLTAGAWTVAVTRNGKPTAKTVIVVTDYSVSIPLSTIPEFTYTGDYEIVNDSDEPIAVSEGNWKIRFLTSGTLTFTNLNGAENGIDVFLVGGGGSGAGGGSNSDDGGYVQGAGAGGGYTKTTKNVAVEVDTEYTITIGSGGIGHAAYRTNGKSGGTTSAFGQSALGGSGGNANCHGGNGGSGGGAAGFGSNDRGAAGGMDGSNGGSVDSMPGGKGQGTTTREFGEENGKLYSSGGDGYKSPPTARDANSGNGGHGNGYGENKDGAGGSGIAIIRNARGAA